MAIYEFSVKEVKRDGFIAWNAVEDSTAKEFALNNNGKFVVGEFLEISEYLDRNYNLSFNVSYVASLGDSLNENTWTYKRNGNVTVIVKDIPRTVFRLTKF